MKKNKYDNYNPIDYQQQIRKNINEDNINYIKVIMILIIIIIIATLILITKAISNAITPAESISVASTSVQDSEEQRKIKEEEIKKKKEQERIQKQKEQERIQKEREEKLPKLTDVGKENMAHIYSSETKRVFLTFDDGPSNVTPQILDTLKNENVKATFFMLGCNVINFPETTKRVWDEGHYIANHGYSHSYSSIYSSTQAVLDEFNSCNEEVRKALGEPEYNSHLFRFPGGMPGGQYADLKKEAKQLLEDNEIMSVDWNALTGDAETQNPVAENLMERLKETSEGKNSVVLLMHDAQAKKVTADMLSDIIAYFKDQGYEFKTFYDIIK